MRNWQTRTTHRRRLTWNGISKVERVRRLGLEARQPAGYTLGEFSIGASDQYRWQALGMLNTNSNL
jgi:hypothetical protein